MSRTLLGKVTFVSIAAMLLVSLFAAAIVLSLLFIGNAAAYLGGQTVEELREIGIFHANINRAFGETISFIRSGDEDEQEEAEEAVDAARVALSHIEEQRLASGSAPSSEQGMQALLQEQRGLLNQVETALDGVFSAFAAGDEEALEQHIEVLEGLEDLAEDLEEEAQIVIGEDIAAARQQVTGLINAVLVGVAAIFLLVLGLIVLARRQLSRVVLQPINSISAAAQEVAEGDLLQPIDTQGVAEIGTLQQSFNRMVENLRSQRAALEQHNQQLEAERAVLQRALADLQRAGEERSRLAQTVEQLTMPIVPVLKGVLVTPIVGVLNHQRGMQLNSSILQSISAHRAHTIIVDTTGVQAIDEPGAQQLIQMMQGAQLLGARIILVGVSPDVAETLINLRFPFNQVPTMANLQAAVSFAMQ